MVMIGPWTPLGRLRRRPRLGGAEGAEGGGRAEGAERGPVGRGTARAKASSRASAGGVAGGGAARPQTPGPQTGLRPRARLVLGESCKKSNVHGNDVHH